ncbi:NAD-dependent epimerase/dehydratase [Penicillium chermesinum]|nr:NAD-dependent epimerase/dehydratase [Penicillium chermesinum]
MDPSSTTASAVNGPWGRALPEGLPPRADAYICVADYACNMSVPDNASPCLHPGHIQPRRGSLQAEDPQDHRRKERHRVGRVLHTCGRPMQVRILILGIWGACVRLCWRLVSLNPRCSMLRKYDYK